MKKSSDDRVEALLDLESPDLAQKSCADLGIAPGTRRAWVTDLPFFNWLGRLWDRGVHEPASFQQDKNPAFAVDGKPDRSARLAMPASDAAATTAPSEGAS